MVDGHLPAVGDRQASRWYMFTQVTEDQARAGRKSPEEVGREGFYKAIVDTYAVVFPAEHPCHVWPDFGKVAQEGHPSSTVDALKKLHLHAVCQFPSEHRWKRVEQASVAPWLDARPPSSAILFRPLPPSSQEEGERGRKGPG